MNKIAVRINKATDEDFNLLYRWAEQLGYTVSKTRVGKYMIFFHDTKEVNFYASCDVIAGTIKHDKEAIKELLGVHKYSKERFVIDVNFIPRKLELLTIGCEDWMVLGSGVTCEKIDDKYVFESNREVGLYADKARIKELEEDSEKLVKLSMVRIEEIEKLKCIIKEHLAHSEKLKDQFSEACVIKN